MSSYTSTKQTIIDSFPILKPLMKKVVLNFQSAEGQESKISTLQSTLIKTSKYASLVCAILGQKIRYFSAKKIRGQVYDLLGFDFTYTEWIHSRLEIENILSKIAPQQLVIIRSLNDDILAKIKNCKDFKDRKDCKNAKDVKDNYDKINMALDQILNGTIKIRGIGKWTLETAKLSCDPYVDIFPCQDVWLQNKLMKLLSLPRKPTDFETNLITQDWSPFRGFIAWHFWRDF